MHDAGTYHNVPLCSDVIIQYTWTKIQCLLRLSLCANGAAYIVGSRVNTIMF